MVEPATPSISSVAFIAAAILAATGVDHLTIVWGLMGALCGLAASPKMLRGPAIVTVVVATVTAMALATAAAHWVGDDKSKYILAIPFLIAGCASYSPLRGAVSDAIAQRIKKWGG